jgi:competence protein ComGC
MKPHPICRLTRAFSRIDLLVILVVAGVLSFLLFGSLNRARLRAQRICCSCNLKQIGLGFRQWALDHGDLNPMAISNNFGGTMEYLATGETFRHFEVMSNELNTPVVLVCPTDSRRPLKRFGPGFSNTNLSYFVGLVTNDSLPQMFLSGDRNITGGTRLVNGILQLTTNHVIGWGTDLHRSQGNIGLADGSMQGFSTAKLREASANTGVATNQLAMP